MNIIRVVDFEFVVFFFSCSEDRCDDFQALFMLDQKLEVRIVFLGSVLNLFLLRMAPSSNLFLVLSGKLACLQFSLHGQ